jgi:hypothetical protein
MQDGCGAAAFNSKKALFTSKLYLYLKNLYGDETWTLRKVDQK